MHEVFATPRKRVAGKSFRRLARQVQKLNDAQYCKVLDALARAAGHKSWSSLASGDEHRVDRDKWLSGLRRELGEAVVAQLDGRLVEGCLRCSLGAPGAEPTFEAPDAELTCADIWAQRAQATHAARSASRRATKPIEGAVVGSADVKWAEGLELAELYRGLALTDGEDADG